MLDWGLTTFDPDRVLKMNSGRPDPPQGSSQSSPDPHRVLKMWGGFDQFSNYICTCVSYICIHIPTRARGHIRTAVNTQTTPKHTTTLLLNCDIGGQRTHTDHTYTRRSIFLKCDNGGKCTPIPKGYNVKDLHFCREYRLCLA